jgi:hypothetical protein
MRFRNRGRVTERGRHEREIKIASCIGILGWGIDSSFVEWEKVVSREIKTMRLTGLARNWVYIIVGDTKT